MNNRFMDTGKIHKKEKQIDNIQTLGQTLRH